MTEPENFEDDLFADLYDDNEPAKVAVEQPAAAPPAAAPNSYDPSFNDTAQVAEHDGGGDSHMINEEYEDDDDEVDFNLGNGTTTAQQADTPTYSTPTPVASSKGPNAKEDGKMFIGGLNWETTDQSLRDYFSQFGEVTECTVMRDGATGRSRGFGFLTFKDPKTVNIVMVKEHYLDGKIIDPKRAIPRDEQEKTSKIFVGGVSQDTTDAEFKDYFAQFGRVVDATLMMDKDTGRPRGFGFVTFESEAGVEATLSANLEIHGKPIEVKKAQPRGNMREEEEANRRGGKFGRKPGMGGSGGSQGDMDDGTGGQQGAAGGMTPQVMAQYWQRMQQYFAMMQQQMAMNRGMGGMGGMNMNPAMMQMMQMQQMQQMMAAQGRGGGQGGNSPMAAMGNMNPQMMQQMMQQMQGAQGGQGGQAANQAGANKPGYNAFEQQAFEQQKYDQQRGPRGPRQDMQQQYAQGGYGMGGGGAGAPTSWEGMYDDVPQPNFNQGGGRGGFHRNRGGAHQGGGNPMDPQHAPPANAPTGPKNAGKPGANYRGGGRGGGNRGFHPYGRG